MDSVAKGVNICFIKTRLSASSSLIIVVSLARSRRAYEGLGGYSGAKDPKDYYFPFSTCPFTIQEIEKRIILLVFIVIQTSFPYGG